MNRNLPIYKTQMSLMNICKMREAKYTRLYSVQCHLFNIWKNKPMGKETRSALPGAGGRSKLMANGLGSRVTVV